MVDDHDESMTTQGPSQVQVIEWASGILRPSPADPHMAKLESVLERTYYNDPNETEV